MAIADVWERLWRVQSLGFVARSASPTGWNGRGNGTVVVEAAGDKAITFREAGIWRPEGGRDIRFHNVFRWSKVGDRLRLEHLRFGVDHPVYLFDLEAAREREWRSTSPHLCGDDCYAAVLSFNDDRILLRWSIDGPRKRETIEYTYSWQDAAS